MSEPDVMRWVIFRAARYCNGKLIEEYDHGASSKVGPVMVPADAYDALAVRLAACEKELRSAGNVRGALEADIERYTRDLDDTRRQLAEAQAIIEEFPHGAMGTLKRWYAQKQRAEQAEAHLTEAQAESERLKRENKSRRTL